MAMERQSGARPQLACEITAHRVVAARAADKRTALEVFTTRQLEEGTVVPTLTGPNVQNNAALRNAISSALAVVGGRSRDIIAVLPDAAIRVLLLDFEGLPTKPQESDPVIRFRLKKSLPFDVDQAALSYEVRRNNGNVQVVAAVSPREIVAEYEAAFRDAGYQPGIVLPSSLAVLGLVDGDKPTLVLKVDRTNITVAAALRRELRLIRTLDNPHGENVSATELSETVLPSIMFFEDTFGTTIEHIYLSGLPSLDEVGPMLHQQTGAQVHELAPDISARQNLSGGKLDPAVMAGVVGALLG
jgi:type IV pilus assembly protein PilM